MRAIIATDFRRQLRKLIWVTENRTGISAGICEAAPNLHATYHADGKVHRKVTVKGQVLNIDPEKKIPLREITTKEQLLGTGFFYVDNIMRRLPKFNPDRRIDALLVLGQSVFKDIEAVGFNIDILNRTQEAAFIENAYSSYEDKSFMVVAVNLFRLHLFTEHQIGVIIYKGRKGQ
jgi:hypothetical protein